MTIKKIRKILIANRGEIVVRIIRTCREMGIHSVVVYSDIDRTAMHVKLADTAYALQGTKPSDSYLHQEKILSIARQARVDAIHPGYGFLSENPLFAEAVERSGIIFIGPSSSAIRLLGDKTQARTLALRAGIPVVPGIEETVADESQRIAAARKIGYPLVLKAAAGGGGKGMRIVRTESELSQSIRLTQSEASTAFGDSRVYMERYLQNPHHVEIQILGDHHGGMIHLGERDCSIQRRHQKVIEESPSPVLDNELRTAMAKAAIRLAKAAGYTNAGTIEFLVDEKKNFYFLEVNTRLQVEHPVTELVTAHDLVREQIRLAEGNVLSVRQDQIKSSGHALECRVYAEDPENDFLPSTGILRRYAAPSGPRVRVDNGFAEGDAVPIHYDPLLAKVLVWGSSRAESISTMLRTLSEFQVAGIRTTIPFCRFVLDHPLFQRGVHNTDFVADQFRATSLTDAAQSNDLRAVALAAALLTVRQIGHRSYRPNGTHRTRALWKDNRSGSFRS